MEKEILESHEDCILEEQSTLQVKKVPKFGLTPLKIDKTEKTVFLQSQRAQT